MRILKKILLLPIKLLVLPLILLLKIIYLLAYLVTHIGTYILSPPHPLRPRLRNFVSIFFTNDPIGALCVIIQTV